MLFINSTVPTIHITPASPQKTDAESYSTSLSAKLDQEEDGYRPKWLSLPPIASTSPLYPPSLRPAKCPSNKGLSRDEFKSLLKSSRDQRAKLETQKVSSDLRKGSALRQLERTTRFLSKVGKASCAAAAAVPEVHHPFSSYGFISKSSASDVTADISDRIITDRPFRHPGWDEQGGHNLLITKLSLTSSELLPVLPKKQRRGSPSLDEITARLKPSHQFSGQAEHCQSRLPNFLKALNFSSGCTENRPRAAPVRSLALNDEKFDITFGRWVVHPNRPGSCSLKLGTRHPIIPHAARIMTEPTLQASRADAARDMVTTLRRRSSPPGLEHHEYTPASIEGKGRSSLAKLYDGWGAFDSVPLSLHYL